MLPSLLIRLLGGAGLVTELCMPLCDPMDGRPAPLPPGPLSMGFPRQEYWRGLPFPSPGDLCNPGVERVFQIGKKEEKRAQ